MSSIFSGFSAVGRGKDQFVESLPRLGEGPGLLLEELALLRHLPVLPASVGVDSSCDFVYPSSGDGVRRDPNEVLRRYNGSS
jgi:hypothetical protein